MTGRHESVIDFVWCELVDDGLHLAEKAPGSGSSRDRDQCMETSALLRSLTNHGSGLSSVLRADDAAGPRTTTKEV
ncbi:MAG: hypothetical protein AB1646_02585 [Thermodesulfobacteriota bacterium]